MSSVPIAPLMRRVEVIPFRAAKAIRPSSSFLFQLPAGFDSAGVYVGIGSGRILFTESQQLSSIFVIHSGRIKLSTTSREGKTVLVRIAGPGNMLGLSAALSRQPYEVTATAIVDSLVRSYSKQAFLDFILNDPEAGLYAATSLSNDYRSALSGVCLLASSNSISDKMAHLILDLAVETETIRSVRPEFHLPFTHEELASMLGSSRETITRTLSKFKRSGILMIVGRKVTILQRAALEAMA